MKSFLYPLPLIFLSLLLAAGCCHPEKKTAQSQPPVQTAQSQPPVQTVQSQPPLHYLEHDGLDVAWREDQSGPIFQLYGVVRNFHPVYLENLVMTVDFLDEQGQVIETHTIPDLPIVLASGAGEDFMIKYPPPPGRRGERVVFHFRYFLRNPAANDYPVYERFAFLFP